MTSKRVIVVGAGLAGLSAAALLAKKGLDVLVLESGDRPGGSCSAFRRSGATYDLGAAMLFGFGERGFNPHRWLMAELGESLDVYRHEALYRLNYGDDAVVFWPDVERFVEELSRLFPGSAGEIREFYRYIMDLYDHVIAGVSVFEAPTEIPAAEMRKRFLADPARQLRMISLLFRNAESLMSSRVRSREVHRFFDKLTSTYCYTTLRETPAILAATMFSDNHVGGSHYPAGSPMALSARLEKAVEKFGGELRYSSKVEAISAAGEAGPGARRARVGSVSLAGGERLEADIVIYAGAIANLASRIASDGLLSPRWRERVLAMERSWPSFVVYGVLDAAAFPSGMMPVEMFIDNKEALDEGDVTLYVSALEDPTLAPRGRLPFTLIGPSLRSWPAPGAAEDGSPSYAAAKEAEIERMIAAVDSRKPGFARAVLSRFGGSPTTIERYLAKPGGSVAGPKQRMGQHLIFRPGARTGARGLYLCGESTVMGTGTPAVTVSGITAANAVLRDLGMEPYESGGAMKEAVRIIPKGSVGNAPATREGVLAALCQWCERPPCSAACPVRLDVPGLMRRLEHGNMAGAARLVAHAAPPCAGCAGFGAVGAVSCADGAASQGAAAPPCDRACIRASFAEGPVPIARLVAYSLGLAGAGREAPPGPPAP